VFVVGVFLTKKYYLKNKELGETHQSVKATPLPILIQSTKTFYHPVFSYSMSYPHNWQIYMSETIEANKTWIYDDVILHSPDFQTINDDLPIMGKGTEIRIKVLESNKNSVTEALTDMYPSVNANNVTRLTIDGRLALQFYDNSIKTRTYTFTLFDKKLFIFLLRCGSHNTNCQRKVYSDILAQFNFDGCSKKKRECYFSTDECNRLFNNYLECKNKSLVSDKNFTIYLDSLDNSETDKDTSDKKGSLFIYDQTKQEEYRIPGQFSFFGFTSVFSDTERKNIVLYGGTYLIVGAKVISLESKKQIGKDFQMFGDQSSQYFWKNYFIYHSVKFIGRPWGGGEALGISSLNLNTGYVTSLYSPSELTQYKIQSVKENKMILVEESVDKSEDWNEPSLKKKNSITIDLNSIL